MVKMVKEIQKNLTVRIYPKQQKHLTKLKNGTNLTWPQFIQLLMDTYEESLQEDNEK